MERICRLCLASETDREFEKIFDNQQKIALKIFLISEIKIIEIEGNLALICHQCIKELYQCLSFRRKIQTSDEYFRVKIDEESFWKFYDEEQEIDDDLKIEALEGSSVNDLECEIEALDEIEEELEEISQEEEKSEEPEQSPDEPPVIRRGRRLTTIKRPYNLLTCKICGITLSRRQRLIQHERLHYLDSTKMFYECDKCGKQFNQRFSLVPHFQRNHDYKLNSNERWQCAICEKKTVPAGKMENHYRRFHPEFYGNSKIAQEDETPKKTPYKSSSKPKKPRQKKNNETFDKNKNWFVCNLCGNSFTCNYRYQKHLNDIHGVAEHEIIQKEESSLIINQQEIKRSKNVPCQVCGKRFASVSTCKAHEKTHLDMKFVCDLCGKSFKIKAYLTAHVQKIHLRIKRFQCTLCSKEFIHRELLNYHVRKHLNIRNYSCQFCQKTFVRKACMLIHERIHVNLRPYSCKYCDRTFIHRSDYKRHEQRHAANEIN